MIQLGVGVVEKRTVVVVTLILTLADIIGRDLPFDPRNVVVLLSGLIQFAAYIYMGRLLLRLPFAIRIGMRRMRQSRSTHGLGWRESLTTGWYYTILNQRRWQNPLVNLIDRFGLLALVWLATSAKWGEFFVTLGALLGIIVLLFGYLLGERFNVSNAALDNMVRISEADFTFPDD